MQGKKADGKEKSVMKIPKRTNKRKAKADKALRTRRILNPVNVSVDTQQERIEIICRYAKDEQFYLEAFQRNGNLVSL